MLTCDIAVSQTKFEWDRKLDCKQASKKDEEEKSIHFSLRSYLGDVGVSSVQFQYLYEKVFTWKILCLDCWPKLYSYVAVYSRSQCLAFNKLSKGLAEREKRPGENETWEWILSFWTTEQPNWIITKQQQRQAGRINIYLKIILFISFPVLFFFFFCKLHKSSIRIEDLQSLSSHFNFESLFSFHLSVSLLCSFFFSSHFVCNCLHETYLYV